MKISKDILGTNIKSLRLAFNETQQDLMFAIGLESPNTIANYEKGVRYPKPDIRSRIAAHYRITVYSGVQILLARTF